MGFPIKSGGLKREIFTKKFYVCKEEIPIVTLLPEQLRYLINDKDFENGLSRPLQKSKLIFVFGCTVALRISDLFAIRFADVQEIGNTCYLSVKTIKNGTDVRIKLPEYAKRIINEFKATAGKRKTVFPPILNSRFKDRQARTFI
ncbi:MAG: hypothetical protein ABIU77_15170 [Ferruginibacter sp.]